MVHAFVMIKTSATDIEPLQNTIENVGPVTQAHIVAGDYDVIAQADADTVYNILDAAASGIRSIDGVVDTKTYIAIGD
ncbi:MAG: transcriptional regulator [Haloquadratum sp. J07HQX50]|jgi:DNA-binding Lrp family transcriptional regulator|nr:MAG: transcriptional regulator [Haloquadratum sp. J07HQX50]